MKTKILMLVILMVVSASLMAQTTEIVPNKQGTSDQVQMTKEKKDAFQAQRNARLNEFRSQMNAQRSQMSAQRGMIGTQMGRMKAQRGAAMGLNLTDEQKKAFKQNMITMHKQMQPLKNELGELEAHQKTLMSAEKADLGAINKNIEKIGAIKVDLAKIMIKNRIEMRAQLTEEQRLKAEMMRAKMQHGKGMKPGKGMKTGKGMHGAGQHPMMRGMGQSHGPQGMGPGMM